MDIMDHPKVPRRHTPGIRRLKVKVKSLASEAMIIRREERKVMAGADWAARRDLANNWNTMSSERVEYLDEYHRLHHHRKVDVRQEARAALIAYAFLRGMPLSRIDDQSLRRREMDGGPRTQVQGMD